MLENQEPYYNQLNKVFPFFDSLNKKLSSGFCLVDTFSNHFSFLSVNWKNPDILTAHCNRLKNIYEDSLINQDTMLIILDVSVKNNIATSFSHIYRGQEIIAKSIHYTINITFIGAELFTIKYRINYAIYLQDVACIIIITDTIPATKWIFNTSIHLYQLHSIAIFKNFRSFFNKNSNNLIAFWGFFDSTKWSPHLLVDKELKCLKINLVLPSKIS